jgi:hypothetical protein
MSTKLLSEIKAEISRREQELSALVAAANMLAQMQTGRGRKMKFATNIDKIVSSTSSTGKRRGRPKGSKNKPGAKKTGPKG